MGLALQGAVSAPAGVRAPVRRDACNRRTPAQRRGPRSASRPVPSPAARRAEQSGSAGTRSNRPQHRRKRRRARRCDGHRRQSHRFQSPAPARQPRRRAWRPRARPRRAAAQAPPPPTAAPRPAAPAGPPAAPPAARTPAHAAPDPRTRTAHPLRRCALRRARRCAGGRLLSSELDALLRRPGTAPPGSLRRSAHPNPNPSRAPRARTWMLPRKSRRRRSCGNSLGGRPAAAAAL